MLAGGAVAHTAAVFEVEVVALRKFENGFFVAGPVELDAGFLKNDFRHARAWKAFICGMQTVNRHLILGSKCMAQLFQTAVEYGHDEDGECREEHAAEGGDRHWDHDIGSAPCRGEYR